MSSVCKEIVSESKQAKAKVNDGTTVKIMRLI